MSYFTNALINKLAPDWQIAPLINPVDNIPESEMVYAEQLGLKLVEHADGAVLTSDPNRFTDATNSPFSIADIGRYIVIKSGGANDGIFRITVFVDADNVDCVAADGTDPGFTDESGIAYAIHEEPSLEASIDYGITQIRQIMDPAKDWFQDVPRGFDPANTDGSDTKNEKINLKTLADNWYGSKTKITDVVTAAAAVASTNTGKLVLTSLSYADAADRRGLVIQASTGNDYYDEVALASIVIAKHKVTIVDATTGNEFKSAAGNVIYGVLQDGADNSGTGEGTDVFVKFVTDIVGVPTAYTWGAADPTSIMFYLPYRRKRSEMLEYDERRYMIAGIVGDAEVIEDINNLWSALGLTNGEKAGDWDLTNTGNYFPFSELGAGSTMEDIVNKLNEEIGSRDYTQSNIVTDGQTITASIDALDIFVGSGGLKTKVYERVTAAITKGTTHTIPFASGSVPTITTYKQDTAGFGRYMEVWVAGKKLVPDSSPTATDGEYDETSTTQVTFRFNIVPGQIIEYIVRDDA